MRLIRPFSVFAILLFLPVYLSILLVVGYLSTQTSPPSRVAPVILQSPSKVASTLNDLCVSQDFCFTANEISHLVDVARLVTALKLGAVFGLVLLLFTRPSSPPSLKNSLHRQAKFILVFLCLLAPVVYFSWDFFFITFHRLVFPQGNWAFPPDSLLIRLYPDKFWYFSALILMFLLLVQYSLLYCWTKNRHP